MDRQRWVQPDKPFVIYRPRRQAHWDKLRDRYFAALPEADRRDSPLHRTLKIARELGCRTVVAEQRYNDADYRSEYSAFWSLRFSDPPSFTHRLHFFGTDVADDAVCRVDPATCDYLGYAILRPVPLAPVGRVLLRAPEKLRTCGAILTEVDDNISFFGIPLTVRGVPFSEQDGQYVRCAHAALWVCHYILYRRHIIARFTTAEVVARAPATLGLQRAMPSDGLNPMQMQIVMTEFGLPPIVYRLGELPMILGMSDAGPVVSKTDGSAVGDRSEEGLVAIACRYLNSGLPVIVTTREHVFLLVGYYYDQKRKLVCFVVSDDQVGPYEIVSDELVNDRRWPWDELMVPQPPRVFLTAEAAENVVRERLRRQRHQTTNGVAAPLTDALPNLLEAGRLRLRTFLVRGRDYKARLTEQDRGREVIKVIRLAPLSHWVLVVEVQNALLHTDDGSRVIAEFVFDTTSHDLEPRLLCVSYPEITYVHPPDFGERRHANTGENVSWRSQLELAAVP